MRGGIFIFFAAWLAAAPPVHAGGAWVGLPDEDPFVRAMECEAFAVNPFKWSGSRKKRKADTVARLEAEKEAESLAKRRAFESYMLEEWIAGDPADAIKVQRESLQELLGTIESQRTTIEMLRGEQERAQKSLGEQLAELREGMGELQKQADAARKSAEDRHEERRKADEELQKSLDAIRGDLRGLARRHQGEINLLRARAMRDFEMAEFDGIEFVRIPAGTFRRGTSGEQIAELKARNLWTRLNEAETPVQTITLSRPFLMARFEVSQKLWTDLMEKNPSAFQGGDFPVESVSWSEVPEFLKRLSQRTGGRYRLPTEAEWEYCARAGSDGIFGSALEGLITFDSIGEYAVMAENSEGRTKPCGSRKPNAWGLHDMHGNVWEWCQDVYHRDFYARSGGVDPVCAEAGTERVFRGGSWALEAHYQRAALRGGNLPEYRSQYVGLRLVREIE